MLRVLHSVSWGFPATTRRAKQLDVRQFLRSTSTSGGIMETENEGDPDEETDNCLANDHCHFDRFSTVCGRPAMKRSTSTPEIMCNDIADDDDFEIVFSDDFHPMVQQADDMAAAQAEQVEAEAEAKELLALCQPSGRMCESEGYYRGKKKPKKNKKKTKGKAEEQQKMKKWQQLDAGEFDFLNTSLFPRVPYTETEVEAQAHIKEAEFAVEFDLMEGKIGTYSHLEDFSTNRACKFSERYLRPDRDRKVRKAARQVKDKHCRSVRNNKARRTLVVHHRVMKLMNLEDFRGGLHLPGPPGKEAPDILRKPKPLAAPGVWRPPPPPQNLAYAADQNNFAGDLPVDLLNVLIALQHREVTPEDYEMLLRLDEGVAPKTVSAGKLQSFKTDRVDQSSVGQECAVCMEVYEIGQTRKFLPCGHAFHSNCIDTWLKNSSLNCPLDGLPVSDS